MENERAFAILKNMLKKHSLNADEKEAVLTAIGILSLASTAKSRIKALKVKRDKSAEW